MPMRKSPDAAALDRPRLAHVCPSFCLNPPNSIAVGLLVYTNSQWLAYHFSGFYNISFWRMITHNALRNIRFWPSRTSRIFQEIATSACSLLKSHDIIVENFKNIRCQILDKNKKIVKKTIANYNVLTLSLYWVFVRCRSHKVRGYRGSWLQVWRQVGLYECVERSYCSPVGCNWNAVWSLAIAKKSVIVPVHVSRLSP